MGTERRECDANHEKKVQKDKRKKKSLRAELFSGTDVLSVIFSYLFYL